MSSGCSSSSDGRVGVRVVQMSSGCLSSSDGRVGVRVVQMIE